MVRRVCYTVPMNKFHTIHEYQALAHDGKATPLKCQSCGGVVAVVPVTKTHPGGFSGRWLYSETEDIIPGLWCPAEDIVEQVGISDLDKMVKVINKLK